MNRQERKQMNPSPAHTPIEYPPASQIVARMTKRGLRYFGPSRGRLDGTCFGHGYKSQGAYYRAFAYWWKHTHRVKPNALDREMDRYLQEEYT